MGIFSAIGAAIGKMGGGGRAIGGSFETMGDAAARSAEVASRTAPVIERAAPSAQALNTVAVAEEAGRANPRGGLENLANLKEPESTEKKPEEEVPYPQKREFDFGGAPKAEPEVVGPPTQPPKPASEGDGIDQLVTLIAPSERIMEEATGVNKSKS